MSTKLKVSDFQSQVLAIPEAFDIFLGGGRGGAKSYTLSLLAMRHAEQYGAKAKILYIRQTHAGLSDFRSICLDLYGQAYGNDLRYNGSGGGLFTFPNGATLELNQLEGIGDYNKYQGRSFTLLLTDECGQYATPEMLDKLRSNVRGPKDIALRCVMAANPGDVGHHWVAKRYVFKASPWQPFYEDHSKRQWVYAPSTFLDNPFIDQQQYKAQLEASCPSDPELLRAWLEGDWTVARGAYFAGVIEENRNAIDPLIEIPRARGNEIWDSFLAHDYGSAAPSVTYVCLQSPGQEINNRYFPKDSILLIDELATNKPDNLNKGLEWPVPMLSEAIVEMCNKWGIKANDHSHVADDSIFSNHGHSGGSIANEFARCGVRFSPAKKADRISGWQTMRRLLHDAGKPDLPGLYIARNCEYFWSTVPYLGRDKRRVEDVDTTGPDHAADAVRYGCLRERRTTTVTELRY